MPGKRMTRLGKAESLRRIENAARTTGQFQEVCEWYDKLDGNRERRERSHEIRWSEYRFLSIEAAKNDMRGETDEKESLRDFKYSDGAVIPPPLGTEYWREQLRGDFISTIFDNAEEIWQIFGDWQVGRLIKDLTAKQRDTLFRSAVRQCSAERIAECTGKTKRGVNKLLAAVLKYIRAALAEKIRARLDAELPVTLKKRQFLEWYDEQKETPDDESGEE